MRSLRGMIGFARNEPPRPNRKRRNIWVDPIFAPFSQFRAFLQRAMQVADNMVFIGLAPAWFVNGHQQDLGRARFALVELSAPPIPPTWPQFGIELTAGWARRGWRGGIAHSRLTQGAAVG